MKMNRHYGELEASYLFATINQKTREYTAAHPDREITATVPSRATAF